MSGNGGSIGAIILGVIVGVVAVATQQYYLLFTAVSLAAGGAVGIIFAPKSGSQAGAQAQSLQMATAATGFPVPVIFGEQKVVGNFMNYTADQFRSVAVSGGGGGGKGGGGSATSITGFDYYLQYEYALCMGPIDSWRAVYSSPGEVKLQGIGPTGVTMDADYKEVDLENQSEGGVVRLYTGTATQTRVASGDSYYGNGMNYRNVCWALMGVGTGFKLGGIPQAKTYSFILRRLPKCTRDDGTNVDGLYTSSSADVGQPGYYQANPAAVIYEIMTNKLWGRGLSSDIINEQSFIDGSTYFYNKGLGLSFTLDNVDSIANLLDNIRQQLKTVVLFEGEQFKLRVLLDLDDTHGTIQTLTDTEVDNLNVQRPDWLGTMNELRAEYNSRDRNYRADVIQVQDLANVAAVGQRLNPNRISITGFTDFNIARRQAFRILTESSYPLMSCTFEMNRFKSQLEVGDVFRLIWKEWNDSIVTAYFMVLKMEEGDSQDENIKLTCLEDLALSPVEGVETDTAIPEFQRWELLPDLDPAEVDLFVTVQPNSDPISPVTALEVPAIKTGGVGLLLVMGERPATSTVNMQVFESYGNFGTGSYGTFNLLGQKPTWAITGELLTAITEGRPFDRSATGFEFALTNDALNEGALLGAANKVAGPHDDLEQLLLQGTDYMFIGEEIFQIGKVDKLGANHYRARNFLRGRYGTKRVKHAIGTTCFYTPTFYTGYDDAPVSTNLNNQAPGSDTVFQAYPASSGGVTQVGSVFPLYHDDGHQFKFQSRAPLAPELVSTWLGVNYIYVRPRWFNRGVETTSFVNAMKTLITDLGGMTFMYQLYAANGTTGLFAVTTAVTSFTPDAYNDRAAGLARIYIPYNAQARSVRIWAVVGGLKSIDYLQVPLY